MNNGHGVRDEDIRFSWPDRPDPMPDTSDTELQPQLAVPISRLALQTLNVNPCLTLDTDDKVS